MYGMWIVVMGCCIVNVNVEFIVIVQSQHIYNWKYRNSYMINYECRQTIVCINIAM